MDIAVFKKYPLLGILRGIHYSAVEPVIEASAAAGLRAIEITMNTADAPLLIKHARDKARGRLFVGAGTVLDTGALNEAVKAGAEFIVSPCLINEVCDYCAKNSIPHFPGALTPAEVYGAYKSGCAMVKVFPARTVGAAYFNDLKGPFNHIELLACGGINKDNIKQYFASGASAAAFGESIFKKDLIAAGDFKKIFLMIEELFRAIKD
ncbi:MAG: bifunctional 4-hydroxy-2-oxoglutarate aldolase/2-dehydro-3-deoxy-phosphogluconate aldolase [Candidatus Omnitrophica bacterium]|nr:bifunctional 4-hydroxy-2-oxoglutarate aldolase/2-dehydro-3-deoxy-phosphogluconate aldolase [Candidatus Omnitrophota bacterium]